MKKQLLYALVLIAAVFYTHASLAQNIRIRVWNTTKTVNNDTLVFYPDPRWPDKIGCTFNYQNVSSKTMTVRAKKWDVSLTPLALHSICFASDCYGPNDILAPNADTVSSKSSSYLQGSYDYTELKALPPNDLVAYILYDEDDPADSAMVYARFAENSTTSVSAAQGSDAAISIYPSPANEVIVFQPARISSGVLRIINIAGQVQSTHQLTPGDSLNIPVASWANGIYYYSFYHDSGERTTGKFVVAH